MGTEGGGRRYDNNRLGRGSMKTALGYILRSGGHKCTIVFSTSSSDHQSYLICDDELPDKFKVA